LATLPGQYRRNQEAIVADNFSVVTFDDHGPIKTWSRMAAVAAHNNRANSEPHCDPTAPRPIHFHGTGDLIADVKTRLLEHGIDPAKLRKNAAIAFEAILTGSRGCFDTGTREEALKRTGAWIAAACTFAREFWGENRIVSMVLHLDETTPHIHVVLLPLVEKIYKRWPERGRVWALEGRVISGPGMYQRVHDAYAAAMGPLGLVRGMSRSRAKYRPYRAELADLEEQKNRAAAAAADATKAAEEAREQGRLKAALLAEEIERQAQLKAELDARTHAIMEAETAAARKKKELRMTALRLEARKRQLDDAAEAAHAEGRAAAFDRSEARRRMADIQRSVQDLAHTAERASVMKQRLLSISPSQLPSAAVDALGAIGEFENAASSIRISDADREALPSEVWGQLEQLRGAGR
jgi:hypothetical protein